MTQDKVTVTQADEALFGAIVDCVQTARELREGGGCNQVEQALMWESRAKAFLARHRQSAEAASRAEVERLRHAATIALDFILYRQGNDAGETFAIAELHAALSASDGEDAA